MHICAAELATRGVGPDVTALANIDFHTADERFHTVLKPSDLMEVCDKLDDVKVKWQNIGLHLDLPNKVLQDIDADHVQYANNQKRLRAMILAWLSRRLTPPTWQSLIDALEHYVIGENATAEDIRTYVLSKEA